MNSKDILLQKISELNKLHYSLLPWGPYEEVMEQMESLLMSYLEKHPQDTDMWLKLCMVEFNPPWEDYERLEKYTMSILAYDENNTQALLVLAYAQYIFRGGVSDDLLIRLQKCCDITTSKESLSMLYLAISWYYVSYPRNDEKLYELALLKSLDYCSRHVHNYEDLGIFYLRKSREAEGKKMIEHALANVRKVYGTSNDYAHDVTDTVPFFDYYYTGIYTTLGNLDRMKKYLD